MKKCIHRCLKPLFITIASICLALIIILHLFPFFINPNDYKDFVCEEFNKATGMVLDYEEARLSIFPVFNAEVALDDVGVSNKQKEKIFGAKLLEVNVPLIPFIFNKLEINNVYVKSPYAKIEKEKSGAVEIEKTLSLSKTKPAIKQSENDLVVDLKGLDVSVDNYNIDYVDNTAPVVLNVNLSGNNLKISNLNPYGKTGFKVDGVVSINNIKNFAYDLKTNINLDIFRGQAKPSEDEKNHISKGVDSVLQKSNFNPLYEIYKNALKANLKADLDVYALDDIQGEIMLDKLSMKVDSTQLPDSKIYLKAKKDKFYTDSKIYINKGAYLVVGGDIKKNLVDLKVQSSLIQLRDIKNLLRKIVSTLGVPLHHYNKINVGGDIIANLNVKSDFKSLQSSGYMKINNASISYRGFSSSVSAFNADVKMQNNNIIFENTSGLIAGDVFKISGGISPNADVNLQVDIPSLNAGRIFESLKASSLATDDLNALYVKGTLSSNVSILGKLNEFKPNAKIVLNDIFLKHKDFVLPLKISEGKVLIDDKKVSLQMPDVYLKDSKFYMNGEVPFDLRKCSINAIGKLKNKDMAKLLNVESVGKGDVPTYLNVWGGKSGINIIAQILNSKENYLFINNLGSNSIINAQVDLGLNRVNFKNVSINKTPNRKLICDSALNLKGSERLAVVEGAIVNIDKRSKFQNTKIKAIKPINITIPVGKNADVDLQGQVFVKGYLDKPSMEGSLALLNMKIPSLKTKISNIDLDIKNEDIRVNIPNINVGKSSLNAKANIDLRDFDPSYVKDLVVNAEYFDADELLNLIGKLDKGSAKVKKVVPKTTGYSLKKHYVPNVSPVVIKKGAFKAKTFILNKVTCHDLSSELGLDRYSLFTADKLSTIALGGVVKGSVSYDIPTLKTAIKVKADNVDVNDFAVKFLGLPANQIKGQGFADVDISFKGSSDDEILRSMKGAVNFDVKNGEMGDLGRIDHYLSAANIISNNILSLNLNRIVNGVSLKKTGQFAKAYGRLIFVPGGILKIEHLKTEGPQLSIYIRGDVNNLNSYGSLDIYGRLAQDIVKSLGALGELSVEKIIKKVPVLSELAKYNLGLLETTVPENHRKQIPPLSVKDKNSQEFRAKINGNIYKTSSVKSFRWIKESSAKPANTTKPSSVQLKKEVETLLENPEQLFSIFGD